MLHVYNDQDRVTEERKAPAKSGPIGGPSVTSTLMSSPSIVSQQRQKRPFADLHDVVTDTNATTATTTTSTAATTVPTSATTTSSSTTKAAATTKVAEQPKKAKTARHDDDDFGDDGTLTILFFLHH